MTEDAVSFAAMRAEFFRPDAPDDVVGVADWDGRVEIHASDGPVREALERVFRLTPIVVDDPSMRFSGARGETLVEPGDLRWFRTAARTRAEQEGLGVRLLTEHPGGWDPALDPQTYGWGGWKPALPHEQ